MIVVEVCRAQSYLKYLFVIYLVAFAGCNLQLVSYHNYLVLVLIACVPPVPRLNLSNSAVLSHRLLSRDVTHLDEVRKTRRLSTKNSLVSFLHLITGYLLPIMNYFVLQHKFAPLLLHYFSLTAVSNHEFCCERFLELLYL